MKYLHCLVMGIILLVNMASVYSSSSTEYNRASAYLEEKGEVYFSFETSSRSLINELNQIISIDKVAGSRVYAYANEAGFSKFLKYNSPYTVLIPPGDLLKNPKMSDYMDRNNRDWDAYPTYEGYLNLMSQFETDYPDLCIIVEIGESVNGRKLLFAQISDNVNSVEAEPEFMYMSSMHGNELGGYVSMLRLIDSLLTTYSSVPRIKSIVDNIDIWICPLVNPDGTYKSGNSTVAGAVRTNANGKDLNRGFTAIPGAVSGSSPAIENTIIINFMGQHNFVMGADIHAGIETVIYPWASISSRTADDAWFEYIGREYADLAQTNGPSGYFDNCKNGTCNGYWDLGYVATGTLKDYSLYFQSCRTVSIEMSSMKLLPENQLENYWSYNSESFLNYMEQVLYGIHGTVTDSKTDEPLNAKVFIENHDTDNSHVYSNLPHGDYYRPIIAGTYEVTVSCNDYHSKTISNIIVNNNAATLLDVALDPIMSITINNPNGSETFYAGETCDITWLSINSVSDVRIEYSINNGSDWSVIAATTENDGSYLWPVPDLQSLLCLIRVYEIADNYPCDTSNNVFTISPAVIELSSPNGGEVLYEGDNHTVTWTNKGLIGNVDIDYSIDNGQNWLVIVDNTANTGTYAWTVPGTPSTACLLRVSEAADGDPIVVSNSTFTISPPVITLSSPNGGEAWYIGKSHIIIWSTNGFVGDVKIEYSIDDGASWSPIATTVNDGTHPWTVPDEPSAVCRIRISEASDNIPSDESNSVFTIEIEPSISLSFPVGGEVFYIDTVYTIRWSTIGRVADVKIEYSMNNGSSWSIINSQTENDGQYDWKVPVISTGTCKIRVSEFSDGVPFVISADMFIEDAPAIIISYPDGGEILYIGTVYKTQWVIKGQVSNVKIEYSSDNGSNWKIIENSITNSGSYNWTIPDDESITCIMRISEASDGNPIDMSDNTFAIAPPFIEVAAPNGGEVWQSGSNRDITWAGEGFPGDVTIEYSTDNGTKWSAVATGTDNDGSYSWIIPNEPSINCKVRVCESANNNLVDESDAVFRIDFPNAITGTDGEALLKECLVIDPNMATRGQQVTFSLVSERKVNTAEITIYDALGNVVKTITTQGIREKHNNYRNLLGKWDLTNKRGKAVSNGTYLAVVLIMDNNREITVLKGKIGIKDN